MQQTNYLVSIIVILYYLFCIMLHIISSGLVKHYALERSHIKMYPKMTTGWISAQNLTGDSSFDKTSGKAWLGLCLQKLIQCVWVYSFIKNPFFNNGWWTWVKWILGRPCWPWRELWWCSARDRIFCWPLGEHRFGGSLGERSGSLDHLHFRHLRWVQMWHVWSHIFASCNFNSGVSHLIIPISGIFGFSSLYK